MGQLIWTQKLLFRGGSEEIDLGNELSSGVYILRVKEGEKENFLTHKIMIVRSP